MVAPPLTTVDRLISANRKHQSIDQALIFLIPALFSHESRRICTNSRLEFRLRQHWWPLKLNPTLIGIFFHPLSFYQTGYWWMFVNLHKSNFVRMMLLCSNASFSVSFSWLYLCLFPFWFWWFLVLTILLFLLLFSILEELLRRRNRFSNGESPTCNKKITTVSPWIFFKSMFDITMYWHRIWKKFGFRNKNHFDTKSLK